MPDTLSPSARSARMALVRSTGNKSTELRLIQIMRQLKICGWRRRYPLPGRPDFTFPSLRLAVFVDGCFWHGCPAHCRRPKSRTSYWNEKIAANKARDIRATKALSSKGWTVLRLWEHELLPRNIDRVRLRIISEYRKSAKSTKKSAKEVEEVAIIIAQATVNTMDVNSTWICLAGEAT